MDVSTIYKLLMSSSDFVSYETKYTVHIKHWNILFIVMPSQKLLPVGVVRIEF